MCKTAPGCPVVLLSPAGLVLPFGLEVHWYRVGLWLLADPVQFLIFNIFLYLP